MDYTEEMSSIVSRLRQEHKDIGRKLERISAISGKRDVNVKVAISLLNAISKEILRHAVEEEARLARIIMQSSETQKASFESLRILQEHRRIKEFLDEELPYLLDENSERQSRKKIIEFTNLIMKHHLEEEKEVFPLALRANLLLSSKM